MSFKVEHDYEGIQTRPENFVFPSMLQGQVTKSSQWEPVVISLADEIDSDTAIMIATQLRKAEDSGQPFVPFYIDSPGGSVYGLLSIVESMRRCKIPIYTFTSGLAASCAACVFCMGKRRFMTRNARLLMHDVSVDFSGDTSMTSSNIKEEANEMRRLNKMILRIMAENTGHPPNYFIDLIKTRRNNDIYVDARQALEWNMATDIGFPLVRVVHTTTMNISTLPEPTFDVTEKDDDLKLSGHSDSGSEEDSDEEHTQKHPLPPKAQNKDKKEDDGDGDDDDGDTKPSLGDFVKPKPKKIKNPKKKRMRTE
jgi:ATP-dependent Clp endopeptidase proteolytic subunit ClpP